MISSKKFPTMLDAFFCISVVTWVYVSSVNLIDTARHYGDMADARFDDWLIPGRYLVFGDRADLKELMETELEPLTAVLKAHDREQAEKAHAATIHDGAYIISGSSFRMLVYDLFDLLVLYGSLRNQVMKLEREVQLKRLQQKLEKEPAMIRRMYHKWGIPGENGVTALDMMQEAIAKHHLKPYPMEEPEQTEDSSIDEDNLDADILCYSDFFEDEDE